MYNIIAEGLGYLATLLLAISLVVNNDLKFRWINASGCFTFMVYGILIHAVPIIITNALLFAINLYYLFRLYRADEDFDLIEFQGDEKLVHKFLSFYAKDIKNYFPNYQHDPQYNTFNFVILRNLVIANIFVAHLDADGDAVVKLNYTVPKYRDYKVGTFLFEKNNQYLVSKGVKKLIYDHVFNKGHKKFLHVNGFREKGAEFIKVLN
ncbi:MAG: hypothetical protein ABI123_00240 [Ginsengibacter sp.]|jgi:hypothetical protein